MGSWPVGYSSSQAAILAKKEAERVQREKDAGVKIKIGGATNAMKSKVNTLIQKK